MTASLVTDDVEEGVVAAQLGQARVQRDHLSQIVTLLKVAMTAPINGVRRLPLSDMTLGFFMGCLSDMRARSAPRVRWSGLTAGAEPARLAIGDQATNQTKDQGLEGGLETDSARWLTIRG